MQSSEVDSAGGVEPEEAVGFPGILGVTEEGFEVGGRSSPGEEFVLEDGGIDEADELVLRRQLHEFFEDGRVLVGLEAAAGFDEVLRDGEAVEVVGEGGEFGVDDLAEDLDFGAGPGERMADAAEDNEFVHEGRIEGREDLEVLGLVVEGDGHGPDGAQGDGLAVLGVAGLVDVEQHGFDVGAEGAPGVDIAAGCLVGDAEVLGGEEVAVELRGTTHVAVGLGDAAAEEFGDDLSLHEGLAARSWTDQRECLRCSPGACQDGLPAEREPEYEAPVLVVVLVEEVVEVGLETGGVAGDGWERCDGICYEDLAVEAGLVAGDGAGVTDAGIPGAAQEFAIDVRGAGLVLRGGDAGLGEVGSDALAVDLSVIAPRVAGPPLAGIGIVVEVVKRIR